MTTYQLWAIVIGVPFILISCPLVALIIFEGWVYPALMRKGRK